MGQMLYWFTRSVLLRSLSKSFSVPESLQPAADVIVPVDRSGHFRVDLTARKWRRNDAFEAFARVSVRGTPAQRKDAADKGRRIDSEISDRLSALGRLRTCPVCGHECLDESYRHNSRWRAKCHECATQLVLRTCNHCDNPVFGVLIAADQPKERSDVEWPTRWAGAAVASRPCWRSGDAENIDVFVCDSCDRCPNPVDACSRCAIPSTIQDRGRDRP